MNRTTFPWVAGGISLALVGLIVVPFILAGVSSVRAQANRDAGSEDVGTRVRVTVAQPSRRSLDQKLSVFGSLEPGEMAELFAKVSGYVSTVAVDIGDRVKRGETLLAIDVPEMDDELAQAQAVLTAREVRIRALRAKVDLAESMIATAQAEVKRARAQRDLSRITVERQKQLYEENAIPQQNLDASESRVAVTEAEVENAKAKVLAARAGKQVAEAEVQIAASQVRIEGANVARLKTLMSYATIRAPFDGVVTERFVDPGAFVRSAEEGMTKPLFKIVRDDYLRLVVHVPESDASYVKIGTPIELRSAALGPEALKLSVSRIAAAVHPGTRTMRIEADVENDDRRLMPGLYTQTSILLKSDAQALMIPSSAIRVRGRETSVYLAEGSVVRARPITLGYDDGVWAEVKQGLGGDEWIIVSASGALAPARPFQRRERVCKHG